MAKDKNRRAAIDMVATYNYYYTRLRMIGTSCFEWHGLPESVDPRFLELALLFFLWYTIPATQLHKNTL